MVTCAQLASTRQTVVNERSYMRIIIINKSIIYDGSLYYKKSKHLPPRYDKRTYHLYAYYYINLAHKSLL